MKRYRKIIWLLLLTLGVAPVVLAQDADCPDIVRQALEATDQVCQSVGRNQACYGNVLIHAEAQADASAFAFEQSGDIVNIADIKTLSMSGLNTATQEWGVALMRLQANLPDTLPGQNVTMLLFGNVEITDASSDAPPPVLLDVTAAQDANVRGGPSTNNPVVSSLTGAQTVTADGRNEAGDWLRIQLDDGGVGWVAAQLVSVDGDLTALPVKDASDTQPVSAAPQYGPMQSFYFRSGVGDAPCVEAPDSGILIQTPEGAEKVFLTVNGVNVELASTGYFQAQPGGDLTVNLVEGEGLLETGGESRSVPAGTRVSVPLDDDLNPSGPPGPVEPYDDSALSTLPVGALEREIEIAPALTPEQIEALSAGPSIVGGTWQINFGTFSASGGCPPGMADAMNSVTMQQFSETFELPAGAFDMAGFFAAANAQMPPGMEFTSPEPGLIVMDFSQEGANMHYEMRVVSPTLIEASMVMNFEGCTITFPWTMTPVG